MIPLPGWLPGESLSCQAFSAFDNQNNRKIEGKDNRKSTVRPGMFRGFWKSVAGLRCRLALSGYFCMEGKLPMKEIPIWEKSNLGLEEAAAYSRHWYQQTARDHQRGPVQIRPLGGQQAPD